MDLIASEYHWPPREIRRLPLAQVFCYREAILERREVNTGAPSFTERDILQAIQL